MWQMKRTTDSRQRLWQKEQQKKGLCCLCNRPAFNGGVHCAHHRNKLNKRYRDDRTYRERVKERSINRYYRLNGTTQSRVRAERLAARLERARLRQEAARAEVTLLEQLKKQQEAA